VKKLLALICVVLLASITGCGDSGSSSSGSSSSGTSKSGAFSICKSRLQSKVGTYSGSDTSIYRQMENDLESCMAGYGHYPN